MKKALKSFLKQKHSKGPWGRGRVKGRQGTGNKRPSTGQWLRIRRASVFCSCHSWDVDSTATKQKSLMLRTQKNCPTTIKSEVGGFFAGEKCNIQNSYFKYGWNVRQNLQFLYFYSEYLCSFPTGLSTCGRQWSQSLPVSSANQLSPLRPKAGSQRKKTALTSPPSAAPHLHRRAPHLLRTGSLSSLPSKRLQRTSSTPLRPRDLPLGHHPEQPTFTCNT